MESRNGPLIVAIVGCGEVGDQKHLRALSDVAEVKVAAVVDRDSQRLAAAGERHGIASRYGSVSELLKQLDIEAVGVCVPPAEHAAVVEEVLAAGKHVLVEKPLALSVADASRMIDAASRASSKALMGFHMRWHRLIRQTREAIQSGRLGAIESIRVTWFSPRGDDGLPDWRWRRESGGGALVEIGVHCYDLWRSLLGVEVEEVYAVSRSGNRNDESATVTARLSGGVLASALLSERTAHEIEVEICGSAGRLRTGCQRFDGLQFFPAGSTPGDPATRLREIGALVRGLPRGLSRASGGGDYIDSYRDQWRHLYRMVRNAEPSACTLQDGLRVVKITTAILQSVQTGAAVRVSA